MKIVTFKIEEVLLQRLDEYCILAAKTRSEVIREALRMYLANVGMHKPRYRVKRVILD